MNTLLASPGERRPRSSPISSSRSRSSPTSFAAARRAGEPAERPQALRAGGLRWSRREAMTTSAEDRATLVWQEGLRRDGVRDWSARAAHVHVRHSRVPRARRLSRLCRSCTDDEAAIHAVHRTFPSGAYVHRECAEDAQRCATRGCARVGNAGHGGAGRADATECTKTPRPTRRRRRRVTGGRDRGSRDMRVVPRTFVAYMYGRAVRRLYAFSTGNRVTRRQAEALSAAS